MKREANNKRKIMIMVLCTVIIHAPHAHADWSSILREKGNAVVEHLRPHFGFTTEKSHAWPYQTGKGSSDYISRDYATPVLYSGKKYMGSALNLPVILPVLSQTQWLQRLEKLESTDMENFRNPA